MRVAKRRWVWAVLLAVACTRQMEPAQRAITDIDAVVRAAAPQAAKYTPQQLTLVQTELGELKAAYARREYAAVLAGAPAALNSAHAMAAGAAAKRQQAARSLDERWTAFAQAVPRDLSIIERRLDVLARQPLMGRAGSVDLAAARQGVTDGAAVWSKAQAAFAADNMDEAVTTASRVYSGLQALADGLQLALPPFNAIDP